MFTDFITNMINSLSELLYSHILIILLLGAGIFFTIKTKFVQIRMFIESLRVVAQPGSDKNGLSSFQALMVSTASRVGTGNIAGISTAICLGGSGAVFWMWLTAILGSASAFIESTLAQIYKHKAKDGSSYGGPAYYIQAALKKRWIGVLFAVVLILTYMGGFNLVASFNIADSFRVYSFFNPEWTPLIVGAILAVVFALAVFGGSKKISQITEVLVPVMGIFYLAVSLFIILKHYQLVPVMFTSIFNNAFDVQAIFGGFAGSCVMHGIKRGLFSNEAGVGSAPNAAASAAVSHPVKQGLVQMLSVFIDTILICSATAFMLLCSGVEPTSKLAGMPWVQAAAWRFRYDLYYDRTLPVCLYNADRKLLLCGNGAEIPLRQKTAESSDQYISYYRRRHRTCRRDNGIQHRMEHSGRTDGIDGFNQPSCHPHLMQTGNSGYERLYKAEKSRKRSSL